MNRKGSALQVTYFTIFNALIGFFILWGVLNILSMAAANPEELFARDFALTIEAVSSAPGDLEVVYTINEDYLLDVSDDKVRVSSLEGSGESEFRTFSDIQVGSYSRDRSITIPISKVGNTINFGVEETSDLVEFCNSLPGSISNKIVKVKPFLGRGSSDFVSNIEENLLIQGYPVNIPDYQADIIINLGFHDGPLTLRYPERFPSYRKLGCFLGTALREEGIGGYREEIVRENVLVLMLPDEANSNSHSRLLANEIIEVSN